MVIILGLISSCGARRRHYPPTQVSGQWSGSWRSTTGVGASLGVNFGQDEDRASGTILFNGSPCFSGGEVTGEVDGNLFRGALRAGQIRVDLSGTVTGNQMNGSYYTVSGGACTGDSGTFTIARGGTTSSAAPDTRSEAAIAEGWQRFMGANPDLVNWQVCTLKVAKYGSVNSMEELSTRARQLCLLGERWKFIARNDTGANYFVDIQTVTLRANGQVDLWTLNDVGFSRDEREDSAIFQTSRNVLDCNDRKMTIPSVVTRDATGQSSVSDQPGSWISASPGSVAEIVLNLGCNYRRAVLKGADKKHMQPKIQTVEKVRPPTKEEIQKALRSYLQNRYGI